MDVKIKKKVSKGIVRIESSGEIKEVLIDEDLLRPKDALIKVCFNEKEYKQINNKL